MDKKTKILFTHNTAMWYRIPFFNKISKLCDLDLVFTHINVIEEIYDNSADNNIAGLENVNYTVLANSHGFAKGLISKARTPHDIVIGGSWDTFQEILESIIIFSITKMKKIPFVIWREDWDWEKKESFKEKLLKIIIKYLTRHADAILVPGTPHKDYFKKLGVESSKIHIMPNVSNITGYDSSITKSKTNKKILYVGRLIPRKGVEYLLEAYQKIENTLDNTELIIVGTGESENKLKNFVQKNNMKTVTFTGKIENEALTDYYQNSNLVVIPSINEGMGDPWVFVLNEAMYFANPVIATDAVGASKDMIKDNGFIVPEKDSNALFEAMFKILSNQELEDSMSIQSKKIIDNQYQYSNMVNSFVETIDSLN